jgi:hypothetical protein
MENGVTNQGVLSIPGVERLKELETVGGRGDSDVNGGALGGRSLVSVYNNRQQVNSTKSRSGRK